MAATGMIIDGVAASEAIDSSGEVLDVEGCDISDLEEGRGVLNYEHRDPADPGASPNDVVGKIVFAKKIFKESDCDNDRQREYWNKIKLPLIYVVARLFDGAGHEGAKAIAAIIRDHKLNGEPILVRYSIEGSTLERDGQRLKRSVAKRVAATLRPCNRTCHSDVLEDPHAPKGATVEVTPEAKDVLDDLIEQRATKHQHPGFTRLGGYESDSSPYLPDQHYEPVQKTLTAGSYGAAPGQLTGGAALQREHLSGHVKHLKNRAMAVLRDYDQPIFRKDEFRTHLKHELPDASDEFIDHFTDLVDDYQARRALLRKNSQPLTPQKNDDVEEAAPEAPATVAPPTPEQVKEAAGPAIKKPKKEEAPLTIQGKPIQPNPHIGGRNAPYFDEDEGVLHTPKGSFPAFVPSKHSEEAGSAFRSAMNDPHIMGFHEYVMDQWSKLHSHFKAGTLSPEVVMHAAAFCYLSPNTAVPVQELMYGHLIDSMHSTGLDPRKPGFESIREDWIGRDQPRVGPAHSSEHYADNPAMKIKSKETGTGRVRGDFATFQLPNNHLSERIAKYHELHGFLTDLLKRHAGNAQGAVGELMDFKGREEAHKTRRQAQIRAGKPDIGEFHQPIPGMQPKVARYLLGMVGGGNVIVPDTHFIRHYFGLDKGTDGDSLDHIKSVLWTPKGNKILEGMDRYYLHNHDAVAHMLDESGWGHVFSRPEDALFPAFWKNWAAILPFEHFMGQTATGFNEGTTHKPYFDSIAPYLNKSEGGVDPIETAKQHAEWSARYGEQTAYYLFCRHLLPKLLERSEQEQASPIVKMERLQMALKKAYMGSIWAGSDDAPAHDSPKIDVHQHVPENLLKFPQQAAMVHGADTEKWDAKAPAHAYDGTACSPTWVTGAHGKSSIIKGLYAGDDAARNETIYHNLAHSIFGLGHYVPTTISFKHPKTGVLHSMQEGVEGAYHPEWQRFRHGREMQGPAVKHLLRLGDTGELGKLAIMNMAMGNSDRHMGNVVFTDKAEPNMRLIDHGFALGSPSWSIPSYLQEYAKLHEDPDKRHWAQVPAHPNTLDWLKGLDHERFHKEMLEQGVDPRHAHLMARRLQAMKQNAEIAKDLGLDINMGHILNLSLPVKEG